MPERNSKYAWFRNWFSARDKERSSLRKNDSGSAIYWADIAARIETGFFSRFNQTMGAFIAEIA